MTDTAKRLAGPIIGAAADATLYIVPAATTTVVTEIHVVNTTTTAQVFNLGLTTSGATAIAAANKEYDDVVVQADGYWRDARGLVLNTTNVLRWNAPATLTITICGVETT